MKLLKTLFLLSLMFSISSVGHAGDVVVKDWKQYIPVTGETIQADIMELQSSEEFKEYAIKLKTSLKAKPEWASKFLSSVSEGQPLPYHKNLGLTEQEYVRMQELSQKQGAMTLKKSETIDVVFEQLTDGRVRILTKKDSVFNNLIISSEKVDTRWGSLTDVAQINNSKSSVVATGPWRCIRWKKNIIDPQTMNIEDIKFSIGRSENKDQGVIYYNGTILKGSANHPVQFTYILFFPLSGVKL